MDNAQDTPKRRVWLKALFALSLAFNVLIVGAVAGAFWRHGGPEGREGARGPGGITMLQAMERADRREVLRAARAAGRDAGFDRAAHEAAVIATLRAEPFAPEAFTALAQAQKEAATARIAAITAAWQAQVLEMAGPERAAYAARLEDLHMRRGERKGEK